MGSFPFHCVGEDTLVQTDHLLLLSVQVLITCTQGTVQTSAGFGPAQKGQKAKSVLGITGMPQPGRQPQPPSSPHSPPSVRDDFCFGFCGKDKD